MILHSWSWYSCAKHEIFLYKWVIPHALILTFLLHSFKVKVVGFRWTKKKNCLNATNCSLFSKTRKWFYVALKYSRKIKIVHWDDKSAYVCVVFEWVLSTIRCSSDHHSANSLRVQTLIYFVIASEWKDCSMFTTFKIISTWRHSIVMVFILYIHWETFIRNT